MIIFPAIDILRGKCVRLTQGDYNKETVYDNSPLEVAKTWEKKGASWIHVVDLDGAKTGENVNRQTIKEIAKQVNIPIQTGGGIRSLAVVEEYLRAGVERVILGTAAIKSRSFLQEAVGKFGSRIAVSIDARNGYVATDGWTEDSGLKAIDLVKQLAAIGVDTIVYTDIMKDGMLSGPNFAELETVNKATAMKVIASGGVSAKNDVEKLTAMGIYGAIIGKALYDGRLELEEVLEAEKNAR
ncbi:1-(5-phosphoribosyl)-5-[(5-phosphoribosylamino) methylideneamino] imidazole-4-carboxamide isomerase [Compostibacillus humi]|uniref:1-(5-phosphoribosyl)-5-[(5-phosphoribosylamino)methylideneamino] imidazole-4-carboxamide isomerase n=1 Tax=Compostibacillus humi TaxID=1245525 RepID=A0A8J2ZQL2_9BACI|nr:1-(5-phosphoribosyl)-5-[(5-phosphoribosylamino)methylideneamino]imidazole-4-carboxamide isomerase [Compostibacillus humi]GGH72519.1 1-(5-phosphoribosyl)-5-[(5-phosphoribosylamino) methylideneamino] imidazole-4-carboxamide isomerase [Compostibacillus humi]HLT55183.1 1-(5-phosphoribosyl)-5-[(5-phosphoribosylamino)methylideneamino]imidazole-4-carboxamide isomerase [Bacillota bacterium]